MHYNNNYQQFTYITKGIKPAVTCDLAAYITLNNTKENNSDNKTHITTDKSRSQMTE